MTNLTFLHTAQSNARLFGALTLELAPSLHDENEPVHLVHEQLLSRAVAEGGISKNLRADLEISVGDAFASGADLVVCTCSTLGQAAEEVGQQIGKPVMRIDRPMAEEAVEIGDNILVAACVPTTVEPTTQLLSQVAAEQGRQMALTLLLLPDAWTLFEAGQRDAYEEAIANSLRDAVDGHSAVVLAQASMVGAAQYCTDLAIPVLSSPVLGVKEAIRRLGV